MFVNAVSLKGRECDIGLWQYRSLCRIESMELKMLSSKPDVTPVGFSKCRIFKDLLVKLP